jgi:Sulfotransferase family
MYMERFGKTVWGDKTPSYGSHIESIGPLLPEARFVHIIRDGRAVVASLRGLWFAPSDDLAVLGEDWSRRVRVARLQGARHSHYLEIRYEDLVCDPEQVLKAVFLFLDLPYEPAVLGYQERAAERLHEHEGRKRPSGEVWLTKEQRIAQQMRALQPLQPARCSAWRDVLGHAGERRVLSAAGPLLEELGYLSAGG